MGKGPFPPIWMQMLTQTPKRTKMGILARPLLQLRPASELAWQRLCSRAVCRIFRHPVLNSLRSRSSSTPGVMLTARRLPVRGRLNRIRRIQGAALANSLTDGGGDGQFLVAFSRPRRANRSHPYRPFRNSPRARCNHPAFRPQRCANGDRRFFLAHSLDAFSSRRLLRP